MGTKRWLSIVHIHTLPTVVRERSRGALPDVRDVANILVVWHTTSEGKGLNGLCVTHLSVVLNCFNLVTQFNRS